MSISSVSCTPIKPQVSFSSAEGIDEANKVLQLSRELNDSFTKKDDSDNEGNVVEKKHPLQTAISLAGAGLAMYAVGKGAGKAVYAIAQKAPDNVKLSVKSGCKSVADWTSKQTAKLPVNDKLSNAYAKTVGKAVDKAKIGVAKAIEQNGLEKVFTTTTGVLAACTLFPKIAKSDGNGDGIADIAQTGINAYQTAFKTAEVFADMIDAIV